MEAFNSAFNTTGGSGWFYGSYCHVCTICEITMEATCDHPSLSCPVRPAFDLLLRIVAGGRR